MVNFQGCANSTAVGLMERWDNVVIRKKAFVMFRAWSGKSLPLYKGIVAIYSRLLPSGWSAAVAIVEQEHIGLKSIAIMLIDASKELGDRTPSEWKKYNLLCQLI
jgi:hypothetical protein